MLRVTLRSFWAHKRRLISTVVAIVLGVAFVSGTYVFTDSIKASFDTLFSDVNAGVDLYVRGARAAGGDHRPAEDEELGHATSSIRTRCAPSHSARRPTSRSRSAQPSSGTIEAKWLAASWPTFEEVAQAP